MRLGAPRRPGDWLAPALAALLLGVSLAHAADDEALRLASTSWAKRARLLSTDPALRYELMMLPEGHALLETLWTHAPDARQLVVVRRAGAFEDVRLANLTTLLFPVLVTPLVGVPADADALSELLPATTYVLNLVPERPLAPTSALRLVARGPGHELLRYDREF